MAKFFNESGEVKANGEALGSGSPVTPLDAIAMRVKGAIKAGDKVVVNDDHTVSAISGSKEPGRSVSSNIGSLPGLSGISYSRGCEVIPGTDFVCVPYTDSSNHLNIAVLRVNVSAGTVALHQKLAVLDNSPNRHIPIRITYSKATGCLYLLFLNQATNGLYFAVIRAPSSGFLSKVGSQFHFVDNMPNNYYNATINVSQKNGNVMVTRADSNRNTGIARFTHQGNGAYSNRSVQHIVSNANGLELSDSGYNEDADTCYFIFKYLPFSSNRGRPEISYICTYNFETQGLSYGQFVPQPNTNNYNHHMSIQGVWYDARLGELMVQFYVGISFASYAQGSVIIRRYTMGVNAVPVFRREETLPQLSNSATFQNLGVHNSKLNMRVGKVFPGSGTTYTDAYFVLQPEGYGLPIVPSGQKPSLQLYPCYSEHLDMIFSMQTNGAYLYWGNYERYNTNLRPNNLFGIATADAVDGQTIDIEPTIQLRATFDVGSPVYAGEEYHLNDNGEVTLGAGNVSNRLGLGLGGSIIGVYK